MTRSDVRNLAYNLAPRNGIETLYATTDSERMHDDCVRLELDHCPTRHKKSLCLRKPTRTSQFQATEFSLEAANIFYDIFETNFDKI
jgi:hypothetical protein